MLGKKLKELRGSRTQQEIANAIGISRARYSHYENDLREPDFETLKQLAQFHNVPIDYLLGRIDNLDSSKTISKTSIENNELSLSHDETLALLKEYKIYASQQLKYIESDVPNSEKYRELLLESLNSLDDVIKSFENVLEILKGNDNNPVKSDKHETDKE